MDFLGFLWPNLAFSMGYTESKQKILFPCHTAAEISQIAVLVPSLSPALDRRRCGLYPASRKQFITDSFFPQTIIPANLIAAKRASETPGHCEAQDGADGPPSYAQYNCILGAKSVERPSSGPFNTPLVGIPLRGLLRT